GINRAVGLELVDPGQSRVGRKRQPVPNRETGVELRPQERRQRRDAPRAISEAELVYGAGRQRVRLGKSVLPELRELHSGKRRNCEPTQCLLRSNLHAPAHEIAAEAAGRSLGRADAYNAARLIVAAEAERTGGYAVKTWTSFKCAPSR